MAKITLPVDKIKNALADLRATIDRAISWLPTQGEVSLEIPEPYDHAVMGPEKAVNCFAAVLDECVEIGILLGVLKAMLPAVPNRKPKK